MFKILVINEFGSNETLDLPIIPRVGDTIPIFYQTYPIVKTVVLMPEKVMPECKGFDAAITV